MQYTIHSIAEYLECLKDLSAKGVSGSSKAESRLYFRGEPQDYGKTAGQPGICFENVNAGLVMNLQIANQLLKNWS